MRSTVENSTTRYGDHRKTSNHQDLQYVRNVGRPKSESSVEHVVIAALAGSLLVRENVSATKEKQCVDTLL